MAVVRREVGSSEEQLARGVEESRERPAALSGERADLPLIAPVDLGVLVAIDLHRDEMLAEEPPDLGVRVGRLVHDVAPVAPRSADVEKDRPAGATRDLERLAPPRVPVDPLLRGGAQVNGGRARETAGDRTRRRFGRLGHADDGRRPLIRLSGPDRGRPCRNRMTGTLPPSRAL